MNDSDVTHMLLSIVLKSQNMQLSILTALTQNVQMPAELREQTEKAVKLLIESNEKAINTILDAQENNSNSDCKPE